MSVAPAPSASRGEIVLQPSYFTSSVYVKALRDDITTLILLFREQYSQKQPSQPFALFKSIWCSQGWNWLHFRVFDNRARCAFLEVTARLLLERMTKTEAPFTRVVALFALYTFIYSQPKGTAPALYTIAHIPIPLDHLVSLKSLPNSLMSAHSLLQPATVFVLSTLLQDQIFYVVPSSELGPLNPRDLPREVLCDAGTIIPTDMNAPKKKGRPTKRDKARKSKAAVEALYGWLERTSAPSESEGDAGLINTPNMTEYQINKRRLLDRLEGSASMTLEKNLVEKTNASVLERLKEAQRLVCGDVIPNGQVGVGRIERAMKEGRRGGVLELLDG